MSRKSLLLFLPLLFLAACAKIVPLTGGDKDITPPVMTRAEPDTFSRNFSGNSIRLTFDEFITVDDPSRNIYFSPALRNEPQFVPGNRSLLIRIKDTLLPNTTYTVRLQGAVKDLNEGNVLEEQLFVFSTGTRIDSGSFSGYVRDALTNEGVKGARVMLYEAGSDRMRVKTDKPTYYSITRSDGFFTIPYIREGSYTLFGLAEEDNSLTYDRAGEGIAFLDHDITTGRDSSVLLRLFRSAEDSLKLLKSKYEGEGRFSFKFSKGLGSFDLRAEDSSGQRRFLLFAGDPADSINVWIQGKTADSTAVYIGAPGFSDTLFFKSRDVPAAGGSRGVKKASSVLRPVLVPAPSKEMSLYDTLVLQFARPVSLRDTALIRLKEDTLVHPFRLQRSAKNPLLWDLLFTPRSGRDYSLDIAKGAFEWYTTRDTVDSAHFEFGFMPPEDYSDLRVVIRDTGRSAPLIVSLMRDNRVLQSQRLEGSDTLLTFSRLSPGSYSLKALADENGDGVFTTGSLPDGRQPEKMYYLASPVVLRRGFDLKTVWDFDKKGR